jgi:hypothetical protein
VVLRSLVKFAVGEPLAATLATEGFALPQSSGNDVLAEAESRVFQIGTLTRLFIAAENDLVDRGSIVLTRDDPAAEPPVVPNLVSLFSEELAPALYTGLRFLPLLISRFCGYSRSVHSDSPFLWAGSREMAVSAGPFLYLTPVLSHG